MKVRITNMLNNGDKLIVTKAVAPFLNEGDIVEVTNVSEDGIISFAFGDKFMHMGVMNNAECEAHFEKVVETVEEAPAITQEYIDEIMENSEFEVHTVFGKCTVVSCRLPNGFVIVESSACVSPDNYDEKVGTEICIGKIEDKIWELEGYRLQQWMFENTCCCEECCDCECEHNNYEECECFECDECNECEDCRCYDCEDYICPNNPNY